MRVSLNLNRYVFKEIRHLTRGRSVHAVNNEVPQWRYDLISKWRNDAAAALFATRSWFAYIESSRNSYAGDTSLRNSSYSYCQLFYVTYKIGKTSVGSSGGVRNGAGFALPPVPGRRGGAPPTLPSRNVGKPLATALAAPPPALPSRLHSSASTKSNKEAIAESIARSLPSSRSSNSSSTPPLPARNTAPPIGKKPPPPPISKKPPLTLPKKTSVAGKLPPPPPARPTTRTQSPPPPPQRPRTVVERTRPISNTGIGSDGTRTLGRVVSTRSVAITSQEPSTTEGRWTFHPSSDFPPPSSFNSSVKTYPSGSSTGTTVPLDLSSLSLQGTPQRAPPPPPPFGLKPGGRR
ncbi:1459_t:CDS:2 [Paraglomus occultum]|uniref:1459_t:CDS:1 n=1 Tax=Paraglomus occultum TaxID=144539 RepID=A0A9N8W0U9_9GLOM|nr:1459_t:CDS:2 [Paraglomus occultum]